MDHCTIIKLDTKEIIIQLMHFLEATLAKDLT
jgi:hypothetical protein